MRSCLICQNEISDPRPHQYFHDSCVLADIEAAKDALVQHEKDRFTAEIREKVAGLKIMIPASPIGDGYEDAEV